MSDTDYRFSFSGGTGQNVISQSKQATSITTVGCSIQGDDLKKTESQQDTRIRFSGIPLPKNPNPPVRAGTLWNASTRRFVREQVSKARLLVAETVNGVGTRVLEWDVNPREKYLAFQAINELLGGGGKLRLYVARQLGYALPRIEHVDKFGTVQDRFDFSDFIEVWPKDLRSNDMSAWRRRLHTELSLDKD